MIPAGSPLSGNSLQRFTLPILTFLPLRSTLNPFPLPWPYLNHRKKKLRHQNRSSKRRHYRRAKVNYYACVRSDTFGDDIVPCIDMSRGGLGFRTKYSSTLSSRVHVAVPFARETPQAPAIFVPARIVNTAPIPESDLFRCGIKFLPLR